MERIPNTVARASTGRVFHDAACRIAGNPRLPKMLTATCQYEGCPGPREFQYLAKLKNRKYHGPCYLAFQRNQVTTNCRWCGKDIVAAESKNRAYCLTEAPEPPCGWPDGVRLTCREFGRYVNMAEPMRFVNGKPVRVWSNRRRENDRRNMVWDPNEGTKGSWVFEHRYNWEQHHGMKVPEGMHIHHVDGDKSNNDPEHLEGLTAQAHASLHNAQTKAMRRNYEAMSADRDAALSEAARLRAEVEVLRSNPEFMDRVKARNVDETEMSPEEFETRMSRAKLADRPSRVGA